MFKKVPVTFLLILLIIGALFIFSSKSRRGSYIPWGDSTGFTYKSYNGNPDIDSVEFSEIVRQKAENGSCAVFNHPYPNKSISELTILALFNTDAMYELYLRNRKGNMEDIIKSVKYLKRAASLGHIDSNIELLMLTSPDYDKKIQQLTEYEKYTPAATYLKASSQFHHDDERYNDSINKLMAGGQTIPINLFMLAMQTKNNELFCEAYYNGCPIYGLKQQRNISCKN